MKKRIAPLVVLIACCLLARNAAGQFLIDPQTPFDPGYFDHDLQYFEPGDFSEFNGPDPPPIGWYFNYNRSYYTISRPDTSIQPHASDPAWGNRFQIGYMTEEDKGLDFQFMHIDGPNEFFVSSTNLNDDGSVTFNNQFNPINMGDYYSVELNRTYRLKPLAHGGFLEPYFGFRYVAFTDHTSNLTQPGGNVAAFRTQNDMVGFQLGFRWFHNKGRWTVSWDSKAYAAQNYQILLNQSANEFVIAADARLEFAFHITRDISLVTGGQFMYYGRGIVRANSITHNDQDLAMLGWTFGFNINYP